VQVDSFKWVINRMEQVCQLRDIRGDKGELILSTCSLVHYIVKLWSNGGTLDATFFDSSKFYQRAGLNAKTYRLTGLGRP
jgi:hypothetical protein